MSYDRGYDRAGGYSPRGYSPDRRGRSRSRSPPRGYGGSRDRGGGGNYGERARPTGTSMMVRNLPRDIRAEDLRYACEKYGRVRDVYLPRDYYTG